jgi:diacylglycerol kinase family enzyme
MYFYIYDSFLKERRYERELAAIESRLTDLGLSGKIGRLTPFTNARGLVRDETRRGVGTIVVVGGDETVAEVIEGLGDAGVTLGVIPIGPSIIAGSLGIPNGLEACEVLSRRVTKRLDLGVVSGRFFLSEVRVPGRAVTVTTDGGFKLSALTDDSEIIVCNMRNPSMESLPPQVGDPLDGQLDLVLVTRTRGFLGRWGGREDVTTLTVKGVTMNGQEGEPLHAMVDGREFVSESLKIDVAPDKVKIITGKDRAFAAEEGIAERAGRSAESGN